MRGLRDNRGVGRSDFMGMHFRLEPDYSRPLQQVPEEAARRIRERLASLYGPGRAATVLREVERLLRSHLAYATDELIAAEAAFDRRERFTEKDAMLITYGDLIIDENRTPLRTLASFADVFFRGLVTLLHVLPFYPYSSDRGFSVISYEEVDPRLGTWEDIAELESSFKLMFDGVFNHVSSKSYWFQQFRNGDPAYEGYFTVFSSREELDPELRRLILRPRTSDLLTPVDTIHGRRWVWTTFSPDQVDLNFKNPRVLLKVLEILLYYVRRGADMVRLDAITYLWCELGTSCAHLRQVHDVVKLFRAALDAVAPHVALLTETNVPHPQNVSYFGDGWDEAQVVYNFALPPLVLRTFQTGNAAVLTRWAATLTTPSDDTTFLNLLDSHDGIGLMGAKDILSDAEVRDMAERVRRHGGFVSMRTLEDGSESPYELNVTWYSALNRDEDGEPLDLQIDRFIASRAVALVLAGVPGVYLPSLFGSRNDVDAVYRDGSKRSINRAAVKEARLLEAFGDERSLPARIASRFVDLLERRAGEPAFHPHAPQEVADLDRRVFAVRRTAQDGTSAVLALVNVSAEAVELDVPTRLMPAGDGVFDLVSGARAAPGSRLALRPYQVLWLRGTAG